jgi:uncharacterized protein YajQ (UPF0234 family)
MPSFDVVSKVDEQEIDNALNQVKKELATRYDFRGSNSEIEQTPEGIVLRSGDKEHLSAAYKVLMEKLVKRNVSLKSIEAKDPEPAAKGSLRQLIIVKQGISTEKGKELVKLIKESKIKVQGSIQDEQVRVTGKNKDDLQSCIRLLRGADVGLDLQFTNFRD